MTPLVATAVGLSLTMAAAWAYVRKPGRSGWVDVIWSFAVGISGAALALTPDSAALDDRQALVAGLVLIWSLRLGLHIAARSARHGEDPRYLELRREWGKAADLRLFLFLQIQAAAAWLLAACIGLAAHHPAPALQWTDWAGSAITLFGIGFAGIADRQLACFAKEAANRGKVCDTGLWAWSRHPNYAGEWLGWFGYAVIALGPDPFAAHLSGWLALAAPAFMYWLLAHVSGVPPLEAHMLRSRGQAYADYQARVSRFWPRPPR